MHEPPPQSLRAAASFTTASFMTPNSPVPNSQITACDDERPRNHRMASIRGPALRHDGSAIHTIQRGIRKIHAIARGCRWPRSCTSTCNFTGMLIMDRRHATPRKHTAFIIPPTHRKPHLHREVLKPLTVSGNLSDSPRHALTAKCVTFNVGAIRGKNAA
jgi:hypothetical protein